MKFARVWAALALLPFALPTSASALTPSAPAAQSSDAIQRFGACLTAGGQGHLLLLLDTSASLQETDAQGRRVEAANYLLRELSSLVESGAGLDVAVAGFAHTYRRTLDWTQLSDETLEAVVGSVETYRAADDGFETDYWMGVDGARRDLAAHAGEGDCSALVWLSDGMNDLDKRDSDAEIEAYGTTKPYGSQVELTSDDAAERLERSGVSALCRKGGVADALRVQGVTTLAIGLQSDQPASAFDLMKGIATGNDVEGAACGARDGTHAGVFALAQDVDDLIFDIDVISDPENAPTQQETPMCQGTVCPEGTHQFVLDPSISSVRVLGGASGLEAYYAVLVSPDGKQTRLSQGASLQASGRGYAATGRWVTDTVFSLTLGRTSDRGWTGVWKIVFVDPASTGDGVARTNLRLYGDLRPAWLDHGQVILTSGQVGSLRLGLERKDGSRVPADALRGVVKVDAELVQPDGNILQAADSLGAAQLGEPVELDLKRSPPGKSTLRLTLRLTTAPAGDVPGTPLEPSVVEYRLVVTAPPNYPSVPDVVDFGSGESADPVTATLGITGPGCAWVESAETATLPDQVAKTSVTADGSDAASCRDELMLTLTPDAVGSGLASGSLRVMTLPDNASAEPVPATVRYTYEMQRPANEQMRWLVLVALLLLGLLIPLAILLAVKWLTSRIPGTSLTTVNASGEVSDSASFLDGWRPDAGMLTPRSLSSTDRRRVPIGGRLMLQARPNLLKLTEPGDVVVEGANFVASSGSRLPLAVQDHWIAVLDGADPHRGPVEVVFILASGARRLDDLVSDARARIPKDVAELRRRLGAPVPMPAGSDEWGASQGHGASSQARSGDDEW